MDLFQICKKQFHLVLLETALKDHLSLPCRLSLGPLPSGGGETCLQRRTARLNFPQRDAICVGYLKWAARPIARHTDELHSSPRFLLFWPNFYRKPGWTYTTEGWSEQTCSPSIPLLESRVHLCLKSDREAGPCCHNPPPIYLKWVYPLLPMSKIQTCMCLYINLEYC